MKTLFVLPEISGGGIATYYKNYIIKLNELNIESDTVIPCTAELNVDWPNNIIVTPQKYFSKYNHAFPELNIYSSICSSLTYAYGVFEYIKELRTSYDVIEITDYHLFFIPWLNNEERNYKVVIRHAGSVAQIMEAEKYSNKIYEKLLYQYIEKSYLKLADINIVLSNLNKSYWEQVLNKTISLIEPNFIPTFFSDTRLKDGGVIIGRLQKLKNPEVISRSIDIYKPKERIDWIGGMGINEETGEVYINTLKIKFRKVWGTNISWIGKMPNAEVLKKLTSYKYVIIPSSFDTFNFSAAEAMLFKKVVICSSNVGIKDLINEGVNGYIFENDNATDLAKKIKTVEELNENKLQEIGNNARETIVNKLGDHQVKKKQKLINESSFNEQLIDADLKNSLTPFYNKKKTNSIYNERLLSAFSIPILLKNIIRRIINYLLNTK